MPADTPSPVSITIVIPAYREERRLPVSLPALSHFVSTLDRPLDVIVVDDGSTDATSQVVESFQKTMPYLTLIKNPHLGKGGAVRTGMLAARGEGVILCDADFSMPPDDLPLFFRGLDAGAPIIIGSREGQQARRVDEPAYRHLMGRVFNFTVRQLAVPGIQDTQCGFKAFRRDVARRLFGLQRSNGMGFDVEILYLARKFGYPIAEQQIRWVFDPDTRVRPGIDTLDMLRDLLLLRVNDLRGLYRNPQK